MEVFASTGRVDGQIGTNFVTVASGITDLFYVDTDLVTNRTYYYVVSSTNGFGESDDSAVVNGLGFPYTIMGTGDLSEQ